MRRLMKRQPCLRSGDQGEEVHGDQVVPAKKAALAVLEALLPEVPGVVHHLVTEVGVLGEALVDLGAVSDLRPSLYLRSKSA